MNRLSCIVLMVLASGAQAKEFCAGYADGYEFGWEGAALTPPPMPVMCPLPESQHEDSYEGGYIRGYTDGSEAREAAVQEDENTNL